MRNENRRNQQLQFVRFGVILVTMLVAFQMLSMGKVKASGKERASIYTSTESVLRKSYDELLESLDSEVFCDYLSTLQEEESYIIPGLNQTNIRNRNISNGMIPQGVCIAEDYLILSAYDSSGKMIQDLVDDNGKRQKSVLYVMDLKSRRYLTTITLDTKCHVGSLAYNPDEELIYVADSDNGVVQRLSLSKIINCLNEGADSNSEVLPFDGNAIDTQGYRPSFLSYYKGYLYVGQFAKNNWKEKFSNRVIAFDTEGTLVTKYGISIPYYAQGISFAEWNGDTYMMVSSSYGRAEEGTMSVYQMEQNTDGRMRSKRKIGEFSCPNMSEDIEIQGDLIYTCYESASNLYRLNLDNNGESCNVVDRIMVSSVKKTIGRIMTGNAERFIHRFIGIPLPSIKCERLAINLQDRRRYNQLHLS